MPQKLAMIDYLVSGRARPMALELGADAVFFCDSEYAAAAPHAISEYENAGVEVRIDKYSQADSCEYFLVDGSYRQWLKPDSRIGKKILELDEQGARFVYFVHHSGFPIPREAFGKNDFILCPSESFLTSSVAEGTYIADADRSPIMGTTPEGAECALVGMPNISDAALALAREDRKIVQAELAAALGLSLNPALPLIFFIADFRADKAEMENLCQTLSPQYNVLIKNQGNPDPASGLTALDISGPNIFYFNPPRKEGSELFYKLRVAADCTLLSFISGGLFTNVMMGLRSISFYTSTVAVGAERRYNWTNCMRGDFGPLNIPLSYALAPLPLAAPELIIQRLTDAAYWEKYDRDLKKLQEYAIGRYYMGQEAIEKSVTIIRRLLRTGSFRPVELPQGATVIDGPIPRPPCPVAL